MPRFFSDEVSDNRIIITGNDATHIGRSLRMKIGEKLTVCCDGVEYSSEIEDISAQQVVCKVLSSEKSKNEPNIKVVLFQAMPKSDKLDFIVQKSVELGVNEICPVLTERCVSRPDKKSFEKKRVRLNRIALEAAKQSGRGIVPQVSDIISFDECIERMKTFDCRIMCYENGGVNFSQAGLSSQKSVGILIGSEGGFEQSEADKCAQSDITLVGLGRRILRCETAPVAALSIAMYVTDNM